MVEYITGMDTRIGYPNEHLAGDSDDVLSSPSYATAVGLLMEGLEKQSTIIEEEPVVVQEQEVNADLNPIEESLRRNCGRKARADKL